MNFILIVAAVIIIDQITKYIVVNNFFLGESIPVIPNIFHWTYILNEEQPLACSKAAAGCL